MEKTLEQILAGVPQGTLEVSLSDRSPTALAAPIEHLEFDSRAVTERTLFFALPGTHTTGNRFIADAISRGAAAVVYEGALSDEEQEAIARQISASGRTVPLVRVPSARKAMSPLAASFYDNPSEHLVVYGVTGTEGKSSTVSFIWQLLTKSGIKAGFISTVQYSLGGGAIDNPQHQTTPEATIVQRELYEMLRNGCTHAVVESSSHGLSASLNRLGDVHFDCAVFMNVTLEHLEFHKTYEQYRSDKANLFRQLDKWSHEKRIGESPEKTLVPALAIVNAEDEAAPYFADCTKSRVIAFAGEDARTFTGKKIPLHRIQGISATQDALSFSVRSDGESGAFTVRSPTPGAFNAYNITAAILAVSGTTGISPEELSERCRSLASVRGRMTVIDEGQPFEVIVDYAHTPSSFQTVLPPLRKRCTGNMLCVFGSGGERDVTKRPLQGEIAARCCDTVILTDEDPRQEDRMQIIEMIAEGARRGGKTDGTSLLLVPDRPTAIRTAIGRAKKGDIVLLLGKSHENSIIYKDHIMPYDEIAEARKALAEAGFKKEAD